MTGLVKIVSFVVVVLLCPVLAAVPGSPSNDKVDREVDEIIKDPQYNWLREGGKEASSAKPPHHKGKHGGAGAGEVSEMPEAGDGCSFEPDFRDLDPPEDQPSDSGCGNSEPPDCDCAPDLGNCACDPVIGNCGACAPSASTMVPIGYAVGIAALLLIIFFVVKALIRQLPEADTPLEEVDEEIEPDHIRVSRIHQWNADDLLSRAREAAVRGDFKAAVGFIYLSAISALSKNGYVALERSTTNWHIVQQTRTNGGPTQAVDRVIRHFEDLFFGNREATRERYDDCLLLVETDLLTLGRREGSDAQ
ncbi:MAG: DUF4129 domain-containing protein [Deltaproteobacteria bacterium]|nr:DUF4129 domain-containing protein [Deltaproteobacteria bacterium]MBN2671625.1 DUF4129 domain-containing protein [Deltaproteobacteria bacterium]